MRNSVSAHKPVVASVSGYDVTNAPIGLWKTRKLRHRDVGCLLFWVREAGFTM